MIKQIIVGIIAVCVQSVHAAKLDNLNQFDPDEIASEDVVNGMIVCVSSEKGPFKDSPEKRIRFCGCSLDIIRASATIEAAKEKQKDAARACYAEVSIDKSVTTTPDQFISSEQLFRNGMACRMRMKLERPDTSSRYLGIACGCILDAARKEQTLSPVEDSLKLCHEYAEKESKDR